MSSMFIYRLKNRHIPSSAAVEPSGRGPRRNAVARNKAAEVKDDEETERHLILRFHWTPVIAAGHAHAPFERPIRNTTPLSSIESMKAEDAAAAAEDSDKYCYLHKPLRDRS